MSRLSQALVRLGRLLLEQLPLLAFAGGLGLVVWGVWLYSMEVALIVAGVLLAGCAVLYELFSGGGGPPARPPE